MNSDDFVKEFEKYEINIQEHIIKYFDSGSQLNKKLNLTYMYSKYIENVQNILSNDDIKILVKKIKKIYKKKVKYYVHILTNENRSELIKYLLNITDSQTYCKICGKNRIYFEYCMFCCDQVKCKEDMTTTIFKLYDDELNKERIEEELIVLYKYCNTLHTGILNTLNIYENKLFRVFTLMRSLPQQQITEMFKDGLAILVNKDISNIEKANIFIDKKYHEVMLTPKKQITYTYEDDTFDVEDYIFKHIQRRHNENVIKLVPQLKWELRDNRGTISCKIIKMSIELKFLYDLLDNKNILSYVKQIKLQPRMPTGLCTDCFLLMKINDNIVPLYIEFDDYNDNDTLSGGHNTKGRIATDIMKDMCCWIFECSLIRLKYNEDVFELINNMIAINSFPYYRFYGRYFDKKKMMIV
jgi:hypothetical protein